MPTCAVVGKLLGPNGSPLDNAEIRVRPTFSQFVGNNLIAPHEVSVTIDATGNFTLTLEQSLTYICTVNYPPNDTDGFKSVYFALSIPAITTADFSSVILTD